MARALLFLLPPPGGAGVNCRVEKQMVGERERKHAGGGMDGGREGGGQLFLLVSHLPLFTPLFCLE